VNTKLVLLADLTDQNEQLGLSLMYRIEVGHLFQETGYNGGRTTAFISGDYLVLTTL
jgi:hypothetical protein